MTKLKQGLHFVRYSVGKFFFPALEPLFILRENLGTTVRRHFDQAIKHIENKNFAVAQLNLNMVLSLYPKHFLARVYRSRIYLRQKQYRLASEDLLQANRISPFRFTHYRLYREYLESIGEGTQLGEGRSPAQWMGRIKGLREIPDFKEYDNLDASESPPILEDSTDMEEDQLMVIQDPDLTVSERDKFGDMGPITSHEVEDADWDHVLKKLTS
jgi:tetratricopeptide (TPR) repeat protein